MTREQAINWLKSKLGQSLDYDGQYGSQCVDLFNFYYEYITGRNPYSDGFGVAGAKDLWNVKVPFFDYITNDPNDINQLPSAGDIMIYNGSMSGTGGYGHVAMVGEEKNIYYEQNYGGMFVKRNSRRFNGYEIGWLSYKGFNNGGNTMNDDTARQVGFHYLGRHGRDGRPNALLAPQGDLQGRPLTNEVLGEIFLSQESRQWRDADMPNLFNERDRLRSENATLQGQLSTANQQVASLTSQVSTLTQERDKAVKDYNDIKAVNADLVKKNEEQAKRIAELEAQTGNVTINFNFFGIILWAILKVVGIKK